MTPALALLVASLRQLLPLKRSLLLALLQLAPAAIYLIASASRTTEAGLDALLDVGVGMYFVLILPIVSIVLAASTLGVERRDQTLSFIVVRPIRRVTIVAMKLSAAVAAAMILNSVGAVALYGVYQARFGGSAGLLVGLLVGAAIATIAYGAVFVPVGFLTDRAVIIGLAFLLIFENGIVSGLPALETLSPWRLGVAAFAGVAGVSAEALGHTITDLAPGVGRSLWVVALMALVSIVFTTLLLNRRDLA